MAKSEMSKSTKQDKLNAVDHDSRTWLSRVQWNNQPQCWGVSTSPILSPHVKYEAALVFCWNLQAWICTEHIVQYVSEVLRHQEFCCFSKVLVAIHVYFLVSNRKYRKYLCKKKVFRTNCLLKAQVRIWCDLSIPFYLKPTDTSTRILIYRVGKPLMQQSVLSLITFEVIYKYFGMLDQGNA